MEARATTPQRAVSSSHLSLFAVAEGAEIEKRGNELALRRPSQVLLRSRVTRESRGSSKLVTVILVWNTSRPRRLEDVPAWPGASGATRCRESRRFCIEVQKALLDSSFFSFVYLFPL